MNRLGELDSVPQQGLLSLHGFHPSLALESRNQVHRSHNGIHYDDSGLRQQDANADLFLESADGDVLQESREAGKTNEAISRGLAAGTYYIQAHAQESRTNNYKLRYGVSAVNLENEADDS